MPHSEIKLNDDDFTRVLSAVMFLKKALGTLCLTVPQAVIEIDNEFEAYNDLLSLLGSFLIFDCEGTPSSRVVKKMKQTGLWDDLPEEVKIKVKSMEV